MPRELDTATLDGAARHYAGLFVQDRKPDDRDWVMQEFFRFAFKDEFEYLIEAVKGELGPAALKDFEARAEKVFTPRDDKIFAGLLADKLAVDRDGNHIPGKVGTTQAGRRAVGARINARGTRKNAYWPVYAGEEEERAAGSGVVDPLPRFADPSSAAAAAHSAEATASAAKAGLPLGRVEASAGGPTEASGQGGS